MGFFDWNKNGKMDMQDKYLEYNVFKACTKHDDDDLFDLDDESDEYDEFLDDLDEE